MPQPFQNLLNKTVYGANLNRATVPPDSLSVRLEGLNPGGYVEIYSVTWGIVAATNAALDTFDFCPLSILRNEKFDDAFNYGLPNLPDLKDVVWNDEIIRNIMFNHREFFEPMRLTEASNYLIVVAAPVDLSAAATPYDAVLTVRGEIFDEHKKPKTIGDLQR